MSAQVIDRFWLASPRNGQNWVDGYVLREGHERYGREGDGILAKSGKEARIISDRLNAAYQDARLDERRFALSLGVIYQSPRRDENGRIDVNAEKERMTS